MALKTIYRHFHTAWKDTPHGPLSDVQLAKIALNCGRDEIAAIHFGLKLFKSELAGCPDWDFDMKYQLWGSIDTFERLLKQIEQVQP
ncbi:MULTISPECIES: hypothetical protein [Enterobacter]|uniref:Uncharacterized protein n=1 Tax=Enterobacter cloacae TaxID=550 RepID=A0A4V1Q6L9_ENTCL|nr:MULTISPECIES: hypothetical protein [Enterobacter cloacae complex]HDT2075927.1 hypothetical protein [Enterobacter roggenkampii]HEG2002736.1 hypothetical protein [Enterobacter asburiae]MCD2457378.1 hypothetical protein [Enterobacter cloacae complex sp. 2021EL-01261]MDT9874430.1 hypothetical protein [Enterobacter cloacae]RXW29548.1 hypothetical protein DM877_08055 [Enterobacter cloacae]